MGLKRFKVLTWAIFNGYGDRKETGLISLLYDVNSQSFIPIPRNMEHIAFVSKLLGISWKDIKVEAKNLIPVNIVIQSDEVIGLVVGVSGMEIGAKLRHKKSDLEKANAEAIIFVSDGEIPVNKAFKATTILRYAEKE